MLDALLMESFPRQSLACVLGFDLDRIDLGRAGARVPEWPDGSARSRAMAVRAEPRAELNSMSDNSDMAGEEEEEEDSRAHVSSFFSSFLTRTSASSQFSSSSWI
jgi:hypothetical protein